MCPTLAAQVPAATAIVDHDFMTNVVFKPYARGKTARKVTHIALVGSKIVKKIFSYWSNAAGDCRYVLKYGSDIVGYFYSTATGLGINQLTDVQPVVDSRWCAPDIHKEIPLGGCNAPISLICDDASATNPVMCMMYIVEAKGSGASTVRRKNRRWVNY